MVFGYFYLYSLNLLNNAIENGSLENLNIIVQILSNIKSNDDLTKVLSDKERIRQIQNDYPNIPYVLE